MIESALQQYGINGNIKVEPFGSGLIHSTWKIITPEQEFILQKVNTSIFSEPLRIARNTSLITGYLKTRHPGYYIPAMIKTRNNELLAGNGSDDVFRLYEYVSGSHSIDTVSSPDQAYEASLQFGRFVKNLSACPIEKIDVILPGFHDLLSRHEIFLKAKEKTAADRFAAAKKEIKEASEYSEILNLYEKTTRSGVFRRRVMHNDTKISNVLFDATNKGICVVDLDTVMPGYFMSDAGDMMRTYLSPVNEDVNSLNEIEVREDVFEGLATGYLDAMADELTREELEHFVYAGTMMSYMQALRFLTDYLENDPYYGAAYPNQNLDRARNQLALLRTMMEKKKKLEEIFRKCK